jgi:hypothetical protein
MTISISKQLMDTIELRANSTITAQEIAALKKRWRPNGKLARTTGVGEEVCALQEALPMRVSDEQGKRGLDYLRKLLLKKDGTLRDTKLIRDNEMRITELHVKVLHTLDHFLFMGFHEDYSQHGHCCGLHPIYRAVSASGAWFEYVARPWVAGLPEFGNMYEELE